MLDLPVPDGPHPGHGHRRARAQAVRLPPQVARAARPGEVRRDGRVRALPAAAAPPREAGPAPRRAGPASACSRAPCGCSTAASSGSAARTTPSRTRLYGLATMRKEHVTLDGARAIGFDYPAKSGQRREQSIVDPEAFEIVQTLKRRRGGGDELLAYKDGRRWTDVRSEDINATSRPSPPTTSARRRSAPGTPPCWPPSPWRSRDRRPAVEDRAQAGRHAAVKEVAALPGQHARRLPRVLHRPAHLRSLRRRADDQRSAAGARRGARPRRRSTAAPRKRCWS